MTRGLRRRISKIKLKIRIKYAPKTTRHFRENARKHEESGCKEGGGGVRGEGAVWGKEEGMDDDEHVGEEFEWHDV
jgi:hypothetical protein